MEKLLEKYNIPNEIKENFKKEAEDRRLTKDQMKKVLDKLKQEYEAAKIHPGEAIGIVTAESFGEPGTQMSTSADEKIIIKHNKKIKIVKIGKFIDKLMKNHRFMNINNADVSDLRNLNIYVPSLNKQEKIKWKKVMGCSRHKSPKKLLKLTTRSGREIIATDNHSFVIRKHNKITPIMGKTLNIGDRIPIMGYLPENCIDSINILDHTQLPAEAIIKNNKIQYKNYYVKPIPNNLKLNKKTGWFFGAYLSEGNATNGQTSISNMDDSFKLNINKFTKYIGLDYKEKYNTRGFALARDFIISSSLLSRFIKSVCNTGSKNKKIPEFAYSAKPEFVSTLLKGYFDGDGNISVSRKMIRVSSNSKELIDGIALLLTRFKIFSNKRKDKKGQYWLHIPYKYAELFQKHIDLDIPKKKKALQKLVEVAKQRNSISLDQTDMISGFDNLIYDLAKKIGIRTRYINNFTKRQKIGRTTLQRYIKKFKTLSLKNNININKELKILKTMFNSDVIWDEIKEIKYIKSSNKYVYDLTVPGLETFTTSEGIITHNTLNVFHFAGVAEVAVSLGLPRLIEIFDARKEIKTPMMEIYIQKPLNKDPNKVKKIAAQIKEIKLEELAESFVTNIAKLQIEVNLNKKHLREVGLTEEKLVQALNENLKASQTRLGTNKVIIKSKATENELIELYKLKEKAKKTYVHGIKGIKQVLPVKSQNEFMIITAGSNLKEVLQLKNIDAHKTTTNDLFEIQKVLGIEATRQAVINETLKVIQDQGLDVDIRHIMFISDMLTSTSAIKGITRSGITGEKESVLARASFETPVRHLISASLLGEEDQLNSVIENVMLNQPVPLGTGLPDLITKLKEKIK